MDDEIDDHVIETRSAVLNTWIELDNVDNNGEPDNGMHPVGIPPPFIQSDIAGINNEWKQCFW